MKYILLSLNLQVLKEKSATGNGDTNEEALEIKVQGSTEIYDLLSELDSLVHGHGSSLAPSTVRDETGTVYKRPSELEQPRTSTEQDRPPVKKPAPSMNFRRMCSNQTDCLESLLDEQIKTNECLIDIRDGLANLSNAMENLTKQLICNQQNQLTPQRHSFQYSPQGPM